MKCPIDNETLVISERKNIEIDYCPKCRGVWLDRGELDKMIEAEPTYERSPQPEYRQQEYRQDDRRSESYGHDSYHKKRKKESFLGDMFDF